MAEFSSYSIEDKKMDAASELVAENTILRHLLGRWIERSGSPSEDDVLVKQTSFVLNEKT